MTESSTSIRSSSGPAAQGTYIDPFLAAAVDRLIDKAKALGAENVDCICSSGQSVSISVRLGHLEDVEQEETRAVGLRCLIGKRQAGASTSDLRPEALDELAARVVAMTKAAAEDPFCGLPEPTANISGINLDLYDDAEPDLAALEAIALEAESAGLAISGVTNSSGSGASASKSAYIYGNSHGFNAGYRGSSFSLGLSLLAEKDGEMERDYNHCVSRFWASMENASHVGAIAGQQAVDRLGASKLASTTAAVVFHPRLGGMFLKLLVGAISGAAIARGVSFLREDMGKQLFSDHINIVDHPLKVRGFASHPFDGEAQQVAPMHLVKDGVLQTWLLNTSAATQLGLKTTGHASFNPGGPPSIGPSNMRLDGGTKDMAGLMADAGKGLLVTETFSPSFNPNTGDYSVGIAGHWFENGQIIRAVNETTIAGNLKDMFRRLIPGNDFYGKSALDAPSILVDAMTIAGA